MSEVALQDDFLGCFGVLERDGCLLLAANRRRLAPDRAPERVFDLPGGRVEAGESLREALRREFVEETTLEVEVGDFLLVQEGLRYVQGARRYAWRSFFFAVTARGEAAPSSEVEGLLWMPVGRLREVLTAPYHAAYLRYLEDGGILQHDDWRS